jgi:hypothetical protein
VLGGGAGESSGDEWGDEGSDEGGDENDDDNDDDTVLDPTAGSSDSVTSPAQPAAAAVTSRNAAVSR